MVLNSKTNSVDNVVLQGVLKALESNATSRQWHGTMTELHAILKKSCNKNQNKDNLLPGSPSALRVAVNRVTNRLRRRGVSVKFGRANDRTRTRFVKFIK